MSENGTTLILGLGNILLTDEGFGVHVARRLKETELPDNVRVEEGGVGGFDMLGYLEGVERLLVVDVMMVDAPPGRLLLLEPGPALSEPGKRILSFHQVGALELVKLWGLLDCEPEIRFLVTRPEKIEWGMELTPPLQNAVEQAVEVVEKLCKDNFKQLERSQNLC